MKGDTARKSWNSVSGNWGAFSQAVQNRKESWYDRIHVSVKTMDWVIGIVSGLLVIVIILIILEATGVFKL